MVFSKEKHRPWEQSLRPVTKGPRAAVGYVNCDQEHTKSLTEIKRKKKTQCDAKTHFLFPNLFPKMSV